MCRLMVYTNWCAQTQCTRNCGVHNPYAYTTSTCTLLVSVKISGVQTQGTHEFNGVHKLGVHIRVYHSLLSVHSSTHLPYQELSLNLHKVCGRQPVLSGRRTPHCASPPSLHYSSWRRKRKINWHAPHRSIWRRIKPLYKTLLMSYRCSTMFMQKYYSIYYSYLCIGPKPCCITYIH